VKDIGKPCAGKPQARFDEGELMANQSGRHVVAACGEASTESPGNRSNISSLLYPELSRNGVRLPPEYAIRLNAA
jgi:hypothetical protein